MSDSFPYRVCVRFAPDSGRFVSRAPGAGNRHARNPKASPHFRPPFPMAQPQTVTANLQVQNEFGLHARPVTLIVKLAKTFSSCISIEHRGTVSDAKSVMALLLLAADQGTVLTVTAEGHDAGEAIEAIEQLFSDKFGED